MVTKILNNNKIKHLEKAVATLQRQVSFLLPIEKLTDYKNARQIKSSLKKALRLYPVQ